MDETSNGSQLSGMAIAISRATEVWRLYESRTASRVHNSRLRLRVGAVSRGSLQPGIDLCRGKRAVVRNPRPSPQPYDCDRAGRDRVAHLRSRQGFLADGRV